MDADDEEDEDNGSEAPLDEIDRDGIPKEPLKTLLVCKNSVYGKYSQCSVFRDYLELLWPYGGRVARARTVHNRMCMWF